MPAALRAASLLGAALLFAAIGRPAGAPELELPAREEIEAEVEPAALLTEEILRGDATVLEHHLVRDRHGPDRADGPRGDRIGYN